MSALGQKRTLKRLQSMSALPPKADIAERDMSALLLPQLAIFPRDPPRLVAQERLMF